MTRPPSLALRSLRVRVSRTLLTTSGIVLGVAVIMAIQITNQSTLQSLTTMFSEASGKAQLMVLPSTEGDEGFSERALSTVLSIDGVQQAAPSLQARAILADKESLATRDASFFGGGQSMLIVYGVDPALDASVREYDVVQGQFLPPDLNAYEIVLVKDYADEQKIEIGDDLGILTPEGLEYVRVVGFMAKKGAGSVNNGVFGVLPLGAAQSIFFRGGDLDQIDVVAQPGYTGGDALEALRLTIQERLGDNFTVAYPATQGRRVIQMLDVYQMGLSFFSVIAIIVGAFLIYNAFSMTVVERTREIGMLRTLGMTRAQVMRQILTEAGLLGVIGSALGVGAGILLSFGLIRLMEYLLSQPVRQVQVPTGGLVTSVAVGLVVTLVAAALPAMQASRTSPLEALRARGSSQEGWMVRRAWPWGLGLLGLAVVGFLVRAPSPWSFVVSNSAVVAMYTGMTFVLPAILGGWERAARPILRRVYGSAGRLGSSNVQRARQRSTLTVTALVTGVAMLYGIQALTASFERDVRVWIDGYIGGDLYVYSSEPLRSDFGQHLQAVEGVAAVTPMRRFEVKATWPDGTEDTLLFNAIEPESYQTVTSFVFSGEGSEPGPAMQRLAAGDTVFVSTVIADKYGLKLGDSLRLQTRRGQRPFEVVAVVVDFNERGFVVEGSWKDMRRYFGIDDVNAFQVKLQAGFSQPAVRDEIDRLYGVRHHLTIESNEVLKSEAMTITAQAFSMFDVLALIAMVVAALGVMNTLMMNVMERTREIGMLRGVGMTRGQIAMMILAEAGMLGLIGGLVGVLFGILQSRLFILGANMTQGYRLALVLPLSGIAIGFGIAIVVSHLAALWPASRAARLRIIDAIQFE